MQNPEAPEEAPEPTDPALADDLAYEPPTELTQEAPEEPPRRRAPSSTALKIAAVAVAVLAVGAALLLYRGHHRRKVIATGLSQADALLRLDTAAGYRKAASLLEPIAQLDPLDGASVRAFALAMLRADYRQTDAEAEIENLLVAPVRAEKVPAYAQLAIGALALGRGEAGSATTAVTRAGALPWALALRARIALQAGSVDGALEPAAAAAERALPAGLALHGDVLRRLRKDPAASRAAYEAALAASPGHARAAYGLAKLALSRAAPGERAEAALRRLVEDREGTPAPERARAALHLAALRLRAGDAPGGAAALDAAGLDLAARAWADRAAAVAAAHEGPYRAVAGAPAPLRSQSDDDPGELSPAPPPPPAPPPVAAPAKTSAPKKGVAVKKAAAPKKATASAKKSAPAKKTAASAKKPAAKKAATKKAAAKKPPPKTTASR